METKPFVTLLSVPTGVSIPLCVPRLGAVQDESCPRAAPGVVGVRGFASGLHLLMLPGLLRLGQESSWPHWGDVSLLQPQASGAGGMPYPLNAGSTPSINLVGWGLSPQHPPGTDTISKTSAKGHVLLDERGPEKRQLIISSERCSGKRQCGARLGVELPDR